MSAHGYLIAGALLLSTAAVGQAQRPDGPPDAQRRMRVMGSEVELRHMETGPMHRPGMDGPAMGGSLASMLLARTGELKLTDQQVTRLAAIARRAEERHRAMRASMDSLHRAHMKMMEDRPVPPTMMEDQMRPIHQRMMEQERADVRDALSVLTIDQQTDAWMARGGGGGGMGPGPMPMRMRIRRQG